MDLDFSVWIEASAGTGKTRALTNRVLSLILNREEFSKILCITFTNNAVCEIEERILNKLKFWSCASEVEIVQDIELILGYSPSAEKIYHAKGLYLKYLSSKEKINIQTIHSFCSQILTLFPLEANISSHYRVVDSYLVEEIIHKIKNNLISSSEFENISEYLLQNLHDFSINELFEEIIVNRGKFCQNTKKNLVQEIDHIISLYQENKIFVENTYQLFVQNPIFKKFIENPDVKSVKHFFLTQKNTLRKINYKKFSEDDKDQLQKLQLELFQLEENFLLNELVSHSRIIQNIALIIIGQYEEYKAYLGVLDYEDLIIKVRDLLYNSEKRAWVLYKLDVTLDHILIDEAQDTSQLQWSIIESLMEGIYYFQNKSIFVVGDPKQSIFSFQGASSESYVNFKNLLKRNFLHANKKLLEKKLDISYRLPQSVNDLVYNIFQDIDKLYPELKIDINKISPCDNRVGKVELWPLHKSSRESSYFWPILDDTNEDMFVNDSYVNLSLDIVNFVFKTLKSKVILKSTKSIVKESDFLILFRKRSTLTREVVRAFRNHNIAISVLGKNSLTDYIVVRDIICLIKFLVNREDDLNLASLIKSSILGIDDFELELIISCKANNMSLWEFIENIHLSKIDSGKNNIFNLCSKIYKTLDRVIRLYLEEEFMSFFYSFIECLGYRKIFVDIFGASIEGVIDEFMYMTYQYWEYRSYYISLHEFVSWIEKNNPEIERKISNDNQVRLMSVHSSKGLEAPIVILCDTTHIPQISEKIFWSKEGQVFINKVGSKNSQNLIKIKKEEKNKMMQEYVRLLYVALTRASEQLIICGAQNNNASSEYSWYNLIKRGFQE